MSTKMEIFLLSVIILKTVSGQPMPYGFGVLTAEFETGETEMNFCIKYYPQLYNLSTDKSQAVMYNYDQFVYLENVDSCEESEIPDLTGKFAMIKSTKNSNCTLNIRAQNIADANGIGILADKPLTSKFNASDYGEKIAVAALVKEKDAETWLALTQVSKFYLYSPPEIAKAFDFSLVLILLMAVFTVAFGSVWSGYTRQYLIMEKANKVNENEVHRDENPEENENEDERIYQKNGQVTEEVSLRVTPFLVLGFVFAMCMLLVLLYFFFNQLVYVIIGMFVIATFIASYSNLEPLVHMSYQMFPSCKVIMLPKIKFCGCSIHMELRQFILMLFALTKSILWVIFRKEPWAWILQDYLGVMFSINMLRTLRLPSLKIITILLCTLFFYDIFFVFITPYFTKDGKSVMVEVATGGDTDEQLPMVLKVPHFNNHPMTACYDSYSMLGFGDILVPGLLVSYCHSFDLRKGTGCWTYWMLTNFFYFSGMMATFISLFMMNSAQPALLYLVPFTLIPVFIVALLCGDLGALWNGDFAPNQDEDHEAGEAHPPHENHAENQVNPNNVDEAKDED